MAFEDCKNLVSVEIPGSVRVINYGAFYGCTGLTSIVIPEGVEQIWECSGKNTAMVQNKKSIQILRRRSQERFRYVQYNDDESHHGKSGRLEKASGL